MLRWESLFIVITIQIKPVLFLFINTACSEYSNNHFHEKNVITTCWNYFSPEVETEKWKFWMDDLMIMLHPLWRVKLLSSAKCVMAMITIKIRILGSYQLVGKLTCKQPSIKTGFRFENHQFADGWRDYPHNGFVIAEVPWTCTDQVALMLLIDGSTVPFLPNL